MHVRSEAEARMWRFVSSPTIRINGADIAFELRESSCGSEACVDGCGDQIACRVWVFGDREYTEPPVELIIDAILRQVYGPPHRLRRGPALSAAGQPGPLLRRHAAPSGTAESVAVTGSAMLLTG